jgi:hypothetical protein
MFRNILIGLIVLLAFTFVLNTFDNSKFQRQEFNNICHALYSEKVWIDTCYLPVTQDKNLYELAMKIEITGIFVTGLVLASRYLHQSRLV